MLRIRGIALVAVSLAVVGCVRSAPALVRPPKVPTSSVAAAPTGSPRTADHPAPPRSARPARVVRVVDGDTIVLTGIGVGEVDRRTSGHKARLIGIDTPEIYGGAECLGAQASAFTRRFLDAEDVLVDFDVGTLDRYGRALVYVWLTDGTFFNAHIVTQGFALPMTVPPNLRFAELFVRAAADARAASRGLWSSC
jgi:micrococcal nuclease